MSDPACIFAATLADALAGLGISASESQLDQLSAHYLAMIEANRTMNLTRITDPAEAAVKHYADSLAVLAWAGDQGFVPTSVLDVGTGAGFPAWPVAVLKPDWSVTAIDSTNKKIGFVESAARKLGLGNLHATHARAEHWNPRRMFSLVLARAVAPMATCIEKSAHLIEPGGWLVLYKQMKIESEELDSGHKMAAGSDLTVQKPWTYELSLADTILKRSLRLFRKNV